jgi:hypothetical protein
VNFQKTVILRLLRESHSSEDFWTPFFNGVVTAVGIRPNHSDENQEWQVF